MVNYFQEKMFATQDLYIKKTPNWLMNMNIRMNVRINLMPSIV